MDKWLEIPKFQVASPFGDKLCHNKLFRFQEEWFEYATYVNNPDNKPARDTICDPLKSDMNKTGTRLIRAIYTAHNKNINFE